MMRRTTQMMSRLYIAACLASPVNLLAQPPGAPRPAYSPYLNLTRPGNVANNYYGLVRPQIATNNAIYGLQNQYGTLSQAIDNSAASGGSGLTTGHPSSFLNYSHYYALRGHQVGTNSIGSQTAVNRPPSAQASTRSMTPAASSRVSSVR